MYSFFLQGGSRVAASTLSRSSGPYVSVEILSKDTTIGTLTIPRVSNKDAGEYTCVPASLKSATVTLHVLNGKKVSILFYIYVWSNILYLKYCITKKLEGQ